MFKELEKFDANISQFANNRYIVKFENSLNRVIFNSFGKEDFDIYATIISKVKYKGTEFVDFTFDELKSRIDTHKNYSATEFLDKLTSMNAKLVSSHIRSDTDEYVHQFTFFSDFITDLEKETLRVRVSDRYCYIVNEFDTGFTRFELEEFVSYESKFIARFFMQMKQYRTTGYFKMRLVEFREKFNVPKEYRFAHIEKRMLDLLEVELKNYNISYEIIKGNKGKVGRPKIEALAFHFDKELIDNNVIIGNRIYTIGDVISYKGCTLALDDKNFDKLNWVKILDVYEYKDSVCIEVENQDDGYVNDICFNNHETAVNYIEKYLK